MSYNRAQKKDKLLWGNRQCWPGASQVYKDDLHLKKQTFKKYNPLQVSTRKKTRIENYEVFRDLKSLLGKSILGSAWSTRFVK